jgi:hypothetical protein
MNEIKNTTDLNSNEIEELISRWVPNNEIVSMTISRDNEDYVMVETETKDGFSFRDFISNEYELLD